MNTTTGIAGEPASEVQSAAPRTFPAGPGGVQLDAEVVSEPAAPLPQSPVGAGAVGTSAQPGVEVPPPVRFNVNVPVGAKLRVVVKSIRENWWRTAAVCSTLAAAVFFFLWMAAAGTGISAVSTVIEKDNEAAYYRRQFELKQIEAQQAWQQAYENANAPWYKRLNKWRW